jgi:hypothetical protein
MTRATLAALLLTALVAQDRPQSGGNEQFLAAKKLYAAGEYEQALTRLTTATAEGGAAEVNQYRALCLLALGRAEEAEQSLEELVTQQPLFTMTELDVSPRLVTMFHQVRRRLLPAATRDLYAKARISYEQKLYAKASAQLKDLLRLLADEDLGSEATSLADLRIIAEGFLKLSEIEIAAAAKAEADAAEKQKAAEAAAELARRQAEPPEVRIYTEDDKDVTPPVTIDQKLPPWNPQTPAAAMLGYRGVLRIVIDEQGKVEQASLVERVLESYDPLLIAAARQWTFRPARRDGQPVKYQRLIGIFLQPKAP